jgi:hypothetical protein
MMLVNLAPLENWEEKKKKNPQAKPSINIEVTVEATRQHGGMIRLRRNNETDN